MTSLDDTQLLRLYAADRSEEAFAELVRRHLSPVYAFAVRQVGGDVHLAEDVAQIVFTSLARKAASLEDRQVLGGWLCRATHFAARDVVRAERRRRVREQEAQTMHESSTDAGPKIDWEKLHPMLDQTMAELNDDDRDAVWLRYFEGRTFAEVGARMRMTENTARMRVERALDKLHAALQRRGITSTTAALGAALANQAAATAPAGVAASVTGAALAGAVAGGGASAMLAFLTMSKIKTGVVSALVIAATVPAIVEVRANRALAAEAAAFRAGGGDLVALRMENRRLNGALEGLTASQPNAGELVRLRARAAVLRKRPAGVTDDRLRPAATWRNLGWATPEAALETVMWAAQAGNTEELARNMRWIGDARAPAAEAFARLPEAWRARYGNADRLLGEFAFGSRGKENDEEAARNYGKVTAFQVIDVTVDAKREGMRVRWWEQMATGHEREKADTFSRDGEQFVFGQNRWTERGWQDLVDQIDPATGAFRPRKLVPIDPETGRPALPKR